MNHESDRSRESDLRALLPETLSDEAAVALVEALHAMTEALEAIYFAQITRHASRLDRSVQLELFDAPMRRDIEEPR
jgi:hypothetical protein